MRTGIGWRHAHYGELLETRPKLGFIEVHSENFFGAGGAAVSLLQRARSHYPVSLHGVGLALGSAVGIDLWHLDQLAALVERVDPWLVSDHASFARGALTTGQSVHAADLLPVPFNSEALDVLCANVGQVQDRLRRPIAVENLSAYVQWSDGDQSEPEFLTALANRSGCCLLVDVNNLYVNALNEVNRPPMGRAGGDVAPAPPCADSALVICRSWLDAIAPDCVAEFHLAGHTDCGDIVIDDHGSRVCAEVWSLYRHALRRFGSLPTLIEWDTLVPPLQVLLEEAAFADQTADSVADAEPLPRSLPHGNH